MNNAGVVGGSAASAVGHLSTQVLVLLADSVSYMAQLLPMGRLETPKVGFVGVNL